MKVIMLRVKKPWILLSAIVLCLAACKKVELDSSTLYKKGKINIAMLDVQDSRCPIDVTCIWEGSAAVLFEISNGEEALTFTLHTVIDVSTGMRSDTTVFDRKIELLEVNPYPVANTSYTLEDYSVKIKVTNSR